MIDQKTLYKNDFAAWAQQQAEALRAAARDGSNGLLDWENLAEEIESLGSSQRSALASYIMRIIQHLVKLEYSPALEPRNGWRRTIRLARLQVQRRLKANPSLKPELGQSVEDETVTGIELAIADLESTGKSTRSKQMSCGGRATPKSRCSAIGSPRSRRGSVREP
jgi:Domain of unknown function DUF29